MAHRAGKLWVGTSGYQYDHWKGGFYPSELPKKGWFEHYTRAFDTVEINNTFYNLPAVSTFDKWKARAPGMFGYALKFSRYGTHIKRLKNPEETIGLFVERAERLGKHLGPILVQLPPRWGANTERLAAFLAAAPRRLRWAFEFRDRSWLCDDVFDLLTRNQAALCVHDMFSDHPWTTTTDWAYVRFHGTQQGKYTGRYSPQALTAVAKRIDAWLRRGRDVYAYFNNDLGGHAPRNAADLRRYTRHRLSY